MHWAWQSASQQEGWVLGQQSSECQLYSQYTFTNWIDQSFIHQSHRYTAIIRMMTSTDHSCSHCHTANHGWAHLCVLVSSCPRPCQGVVTLAWARLGGGRRPGPARPRAPPPLLSPDHTLPDRNDDTITSLHQHQYGYILPIKSHGPDPDLRTI